MARPTKCTPEATRLICDAIREGMPLDSASRAGGVSYQTTLNWRVQGEADAKAGLDTEFFEFFEAFTQADFDWEFGNTQIANKGATGGLVTTETRVVTKKRIVGAEGDKDLDNFLDEIGIGAEESGTPFTDMDARGALITVEEVTTVITKTTAPDPRIALELLQRRRPKTWGKVTGIKIMTDDWREELAKLGIDGEELFNRLVGEIIAAKSRPLLGDGEGSSDEGGSGTESA